jgi:hypothetical protein
VLVEIDPTWLFETTKVLADDAGLSVLRAAGDSAWI